MRAIYSERTGVLLRLLALLTALALSGCGQEWSWRQKTVLEVETPDGVKTGSSVIRVRVQKNPEWQVGL